ncbi:MAG: GTPase Era [Lentisphaerae bacterium ADurb.BinA184]|nr:MAG: GTPase Era [Lentisphaerae bacterium ADurb.BinA184]
MPRTGDKEIMTIIRTDPGEAGHCGLVAVVGRANVGKSSLVNGLVGEKVSIVSEIPQTTRNLVRAVLTEARGQLAFLDTPGVHRAVSDLGRLMNRTARAAVEGADAVLLVLDAAEGPREEDEGWMRKLVTLGQTTLVALNKSDLGADGVRRHRELWATIAAEKAGAPACGWLTVSAKTGGGLPELLQALFDIVPVGPPLFPEDVLTDFPRKLAMADLVREKLFLRLRDEMPHAIAVSVTRIEEAGEEWEVHADILVNRPTQKPIVIGKKGRLLRWVKEKAEEEIAAAYGHSVRLHLWVKVEENWQRNHWILKQLGYA